MATTARRHRALPVVAGSFVAGLAFAVVVGADAIRRPPPESTFRIDDVPVEAERPPVTVPDELPAEVAVLADKAADARAARPERLALGEAAAPLVEQVLPQALPTAGESEEPAAATPTPASAGEPPEPLEPPPGEAKPDVALRALVARIQTDRPARPRPAPSRPALPPQPAAGGVAPLPAMEWATADVGTWTSQPDEPARENPPKGPRLLGRLAERRGDTRPDGAAPAGPVAGRLLDRVRDRLASRDAPEQRATPAAEPTDASQWPQASTLVAHLERVAAASPAEPAATWARDTLAALTAVSATAGPSDPNADERLITLGERVDAGMQAADAVADTAAGSQLRRAALAVSRRVALWRACSACLMAVDAAPAKPNGEMADGLAAVTAGREVARLLDAVERFETHPSAGDGAAVRDALGTLIAAAPEPARGIGRALNDHYLAPNVRIAINEQFVERMLPTSTISTGPLQDYVLGRKVRGTKTVEQSVNVRFAPHPAEIRLNLLVNGEISSRTVTEAGSVAIHSQGQSSFMVFKPIHVSPRGLELGEARGTASNQTRLADIETSFDAVPLMGPLVRGIARNQHDENLGEATREVNMKIVSRACREVDQQTGPQLEALASQIRERFWSPMDRLGLRPTAVALETTEQTATARIRLAGDAQLAAHTPRPRAPSDALLSMQVHESSVNNACGQFGLAGSRMSLEQLTKHICGKLGLPPTVPDDLPEGVEVQFAAVDPIRIECRDGLVHVVVRLDALESGRRSNWYDIVAQVAYRPVPAGMQVHLEREGPVQLSGPGHKGRMEFGLRTIFGKMFPKERPVKLVPEKMLSNPRLAGVQAVQATTADGWLAIALAAPTAAGTAGGSATASRLQSAPRPLLRR
ncbi:MAG: hypothetical protein ACKOC8_00480 [Pirellulales bacterium]